MFSYLPTEAYVCPGEAMWPAQLEGVTKPSWDDQEVVPVHHIVTLCIPVHLGLMIAVYEHLSTCINASA